MGGAIARGLSTCDLFRPQDITVINRRASKTAEIQGFNPELQAVTGDYSSLATADIVIIAVKPWMVEALYCAIPNTAIEVKQSMTFITGLNATEDQNRLVLNIFGALGKAELVEERLLGPATTLCSCGIAFAFRYIRAAMEGGVELGLYPQKAQEGVLQTLRGAIALLESNGSHPEQEVDRVTTAGGITIKGLNEMEHAGFTSAVIRGLKASNNG